MPNTVLSAPTAVAVTLPDAHEIRAAARNLFRADRRPYFELAVDRDQTDRCADRLHEEQDASLYRRPMVVWPTRAADLWRTCLIVAEFRHWEGLGLARIKVEADYDVDTSWYSDASDAIKEWARDMEGYGTIGQYRFESTVDYAYFGLDDDNIEGWEDGDSCWGHLGYDDPADPFENMYVVDHMTDVNRRLRDHFAPDRERGAGI